MDSVLKRPTRGIHLHRFRRRLRKALDWLSIVAAIASLSLTTSHVDAADAIYVRSDGNDERSGRSPLQAVATINQALNVATSGSTVVIGAGDYPEIVRLVDRANIKGITLFGDVDGRLAGAPGRVQVNGLDCQDIDWLQVIGISIQGGVKIDSISQLSLRQCAINRSKGDGIYVHRAGNAQLVDCLVNNSAENGLTMDSVASLEITGCVVSNNRGDGLQHRSGKRATISRSEFRKNRVAMSLSAPSSIRSCLVADNSRGIVIGASHTQIEHTTIVFSKGAAIDCREERELGIINSIIAYNGQGSINERSSIDSDLIDPHLVSNLWYRNGNAPRGDEHPIEELVADPRFVNAEQRDVRLAPRSPARDAGTVTAQALDLAGSPRVAGIRPDLGCWESRPEDGTTYYVSSRGRNTSSGLKPEDAWATISKAAKVAGPGDTVYVEAGIYQRVAMFRQHGQPTAKVAFIGDTKGKHFPTTGPVVLQLDDDEQAIMAFSNAAHISLDGFQFHSPKNAKAGFGITVSYSKSIGFQNCEWIGGGTCLALLGSSAELANCDLANAGQHAISVRMSELDATNCRAVSCGIGLLIDRDGAATLQDCHFTRNRVAGVYASGSCKMSGCVADENGDAGIVLYGLDDSQLSIRDVTLHRNGRYGATFADCLMRPESASCAGLKIHGNPCGVLVSNGVVALDAPMIDNASQHAVLVKGGVLHAGGGRVGASAIGVQLEDTGSVDLHHFVLAGSGSGIGLVANGDEARLVNCIVSNFGTGVSASASCRTTITNCTIAEISDIGIELRQGSCDLVNTIVATNPDQGLVGIRVNSFAVLTHSNNVIHGFRRALEGATLAKTEISKAPRFVNAQDNDFHLAKGSPAINAGTNLVTNCIDDIEGNARPSHHVHEIGAYEYTGDSGSLRILKWTEKR